MPLTLMPPEKALYTILTTETATATLLGTRVYPFRAKYEAVYPLALYDRIDSEYFDTIAGLAGENLAHVSIELNYHADGYSACKSGADIIRTNLNAYSDEVETLTERLTVRRIRHVGERDGFLEPFSGRTDGVYGVIQEYDIWFLNE